jgi:acyl carrier protein
VPIGRPIANTEVYVLDREMQPVPVGVEGELYVGGRGLARGYWRREQLTAEKFVPHPYSREGGERLYRTGDRVRWRSDGELEFLGRLDEQVKLRGYRIELGEVEAVLSEQAGVRQAVVVLREDEPEDKRLVAYVVCADEAVKVEELRDRLKERLPVYMIPSHFVVMESLPLTANGKLDRKALPAPELSAIDRSSYVEPQTPIGEVVSGIFCEVLRREQVSIDGDFFEMGGHSLLATQVISRINSAFSVEIPIRTLFERATVRGLAEAIQNLLEHGQKQSRPPIKRLPRTNYLSSQPEP